MSVVHFTPQELGPVAALAVGNTASDAGKRKLERAVRALAEYSVANSQAYEHTYRETTTPYSENEIRQYAWIRDDIREWKKAITTAHLLSYNLIANDGVNFATVSILGNLLAMVQDIAGKTVMPSIKNLSLV